MSGDDELMDMRIVIPSSQREKLCAHAVTLFVNPLVVVDELEYDSYRAALPDEIEILTHPPEVTGIAPLRQWILDNVENEIVFQVDDDVKYLKTTAGYRSRSMIIRDPETITQLIATCAYTAREIGAPIFGFGQHQGNVKYFRPQDPFSFSGWVGTAIGFVGRSIEFDKSLKLRADIDACLRALLNDRIIFVDNRFGFVIEDRFLQGGGNQRNRSSLENDRNMRVLADRWGKWLKPKMRKTAVILSVRVRRRQSASAFD